MNSDMENIEERVAYLLSESHTSLGDRSEVIQIVSELAIKLQEQIRVSCFYADGNKELCKQADDLEKSVVCLQEQNSNLMEALRVAKQSGASIAAYNCTITKELETLKATGFNVQDVVDWAKNTIHHKSKCGSHDCIYVDELINYLEKLDQASDNKDGEENE